MNINIFEFLMIYIFVSPRVVVILKKMIFIASISTYMYAPSYCISTTGIHMILNIMLNTMKYTTNTNGLWRQMKMKIIQYPLSKCLKE